VLLDGAFDRFFLVFFEFAELLLLLFRAEGDLLLFFTVFEDPTLSAEGMSHHMSSAFKRPAILLVHKKINTL